MAKISKDKIKAYALKNALQHNGKAKESKVIASLFHEGLEKEEVDEVLSKVRGIVKEVNKLKIDEQEKEFEKLEDKVDEREEREGLPELPDVDKKKGVIMRFSPSPSGPMHIGHALTGMPSSLYVKKYGGEFILRIEDTNPKNIYEPAYGMLQKEAEWLFGKISGISKINIQSDRIPVYYKYVEKLIELEKVYVCVCSPEEFKKNVEKRKTCDCRKLSKEETKERWKKMLGKGKDKYKEGEAVVRFKSDLRLNNPALIDFPLARIINDKHPRQGKKYRVFPLMNLAVTVDDIEENVTHIIRAKDHRDNAKRQEMIFSALGKKFPWTGFLGRYHFTDMELSASKMRKAIEEGKYKGWDDPNLPTIASLAKKGYKSEAFALMAEERGLSEVDKKLSKKDFFELLDNYQKQVK